MTSTYSTVYYRSQPMQLSKKKGSQVPVPHTYNPGYSGGRFQEHRGSMPAWANTLQNPIWKMPNTERASGVAQDVGLQFKLHNRKKKVQKLK
jgi:hypothetical protein